MMTQIRTPSNKSQYFLPKETFLTVVHYCRQYPIWLSELNALSDSRHGVDYDSDRIQSSGSHDQVFDIVAQREKLVTKKDVIEKTAAAVSGGLQSWLILGVCYGLTYFQLADRGIPCGKDLYYQMRRKFYFELSKRI